MAAIRASVRTVWRHDNLDAWTTADLLGLCHRWFTHATSEDKLAAVLLLAEHLPSRLTLSHTDALAWPLAEGQIADWNVCDWYASKALHAFLTADGRRELPARTKAITGWSKGPGLWARRAAVVASVKLASEIPEPFPGFTDFVLDACAANLVSDDRFAHTGPGWLLRELSRAAPAAVARFVSNHPDLSPEATRMATARLRPGRYRRR